MAKLMWASLFLVGLMCPALSAEAMQAAPAQQTQEATTEPNTGVHELPAVSSSNQIPLLDNRFRIDYAVEEITLVFFRKKGSPSIVLVKPDGTKIYARTARDHNMRWHDDKTYDLIKMQKPTPGPWQAIGEVLPESRIMVLTDIDLKVDPLPADMMIGESLKVTARLTNGGKPINAKDFRDILQLNVLLISTQKAEYDNFSSAVLDFTTFKDDGRDYDERPRDAIFTGEFKLNFPAGEWMPKYLVETPLYSRELLQDPIVISRTPIATSVVEAKTAEDKHVLTYTITEGPIDAKSLSLQGRIQFPSQEVQSFTLAEMPTDNRQLTIANAGVGTYRVTQTLFGKTKSGREFMITLPEVTFAAVGDKEQVPAATDDASSAVVSETAVSDTPVSDKAVAGSQETSAAINASTDATGTKPEEVPEPFPLGWVIFGNLFILCVGGAVIFFSMNANASQTLKMLLAKINPAQLLKRNKAADGTAAAATASSGDAALNVPKKSANAKSGDDILDLSLPDD